MEQAAKYGHCRLLRRRAQAIMPLGQERSPAEVADILETRRESICQWRRNWREWGTAGLAGGRHSAHPSALDETQQRRLEQLTDAGCSIRQLMALMQARYPGCGVHPGATRRLLRERCFRWKPYALLVKKNGRSRLIVRPVRNGRQGWRRPAGANRT